MDLKEFSKWLWDIAKYVVTGILITPFLGQFKDDELRLYGLGFAIAGGLFAIGAAIQYYSSKLSKSDKSSKSNKLNKLKKK